KILPEEYQQYAAQVKPESGMDQIRVQVDPTLLKHAFRNLIENAFKFGGKELKVRAEAENGPAKSPQPPLIKGGFVVVQFADDGLGIPPEDRERVFERFYQVEKDFVGQIPGAGLGLTMVRETVQAHGGRV